MKNFLISLFIFFTLPAFAKIHIVAAENMYSDIAQSIGGTEVAVTSILSNPNQDPHLFSADPKTAKALADADIIILNGADYDPWATQLAQSSGATILNVGNINQVAPGANPHLWYNLAYVEKFATTLTQTLVQKDPAQKTLFTQNLQAFLDQMKKIRAQLAIIQKLHPQLSVTATEPIAGYIFDALGFHVLDQHFQLSVMNNTEPSAQDRAQLMEDLAKHRVALLIYNQQVTDPTTDIIRSAAQAANIPVIGASELMPSNTHYIDWYQNTLNKMATALIPH